ncbi:hypothetical protein PYW07_005347 [Mythimna separata]|uniref:NACHT domain-containing protein n=1 Tax=Mythimna separata TaxID=271217 RepID=A0AAD8DNN3_MYTSE|nr:hypothetical protein PYW07_005347 [Mythimna separata]
MQHKNNGSELEDKLLYNSLLFINILKNRPPEDKIKKIKKYLDLGADINATDANYNNNTPLHIAVMKEEPEVVSFLLERCALVDIKNRDNQTALDVAHLSDKSDNNRKNITTILQAINYKNMPQLSDQREINTNEEIHTPVNSTAILEDPKILKRFVSCDIENKLHSIGDVNNPMKNTRIKKSKGNKIMHYQKRTGTSGLSGQLYETKLLSLILFRALYVHEVKPFSLATNVESMGAFDDIVFKFFSNKNDKPKIMFVQAKHKDNPSKDTFTVEEIMKLNGDFSLHKYLESYIKIRRMFSPENDDDMFRGEFKNVDCEFIIYTSSIEKFSKMKAFEPTEGNRFINTNKGKVFQFDFDDQDVELLVQTVAKSRSVLLAKRLSKFIFKDNHNNMMKDNMIKTYHVFLARYILAIEIQDCKSKNNFHFAKFRESFFLSDDQLLMAFKATICKEMLLQNKNVSPNKLDEVESILKSMVFKVPVGFGNVNFCFTGSAPKKEKKLEYLCSIFKQLFAIANVTEIITMKVDDNMVGPDAILQNNDLDSNRLGGLVGNLLVFDNVTKTLKFNFDVQFLSYDNLKLLERLRSEVFIGIDLRKCRFDINVHRFPRLSLVHDEYDKTLIKEFLCKLIFYTNQATEEEIEKILKKEIDFYFVSSVPRQSDALFRVKSDAIFLKVHDRIQKWWKQPNNAPYLTEYCEYFFEAEQDTLNSPLLSILNFNYTKTIKNALPELKFKDTALEVLNIDSFFAAVEKILCIITEEVALSSIKLVQYFNDRNFIDFTFIDLKYVGIGNYFVDVKTEVIQSKIGTLIIVCESIDFIAEIDLLINNFDGKVIVISNLELANQINGIAAKEIITKVDSQTAFEDLDDSMRVMLLEERYITFQGKQVPLGILFEDESYYIINSNLLYKIINNEKTMTGNVLNNPSYDELLDFYINEKICRYITLDLHDLAIDKLNVLKYKELGDHFQIDSRDVILITDNEKEYSEFIHIYENCNVHWFSGDDCLVWNKSRGNFKNILKHVRRGSHNAYTLQPVTLQDVKEKVVIISGEPGMGKSSFLTHLAIKTKQDNPTLWISKINLLEITNEFRRMKKNGVAIDFRETAQFLLRVIGFEIFKESNVDIELIIDQVSVIGDEIRFNKKNIGLDLTGSNLFEIEFFIHCFNNNRVVLLFDGFDEICPDFANEFLQLVNILKKSKVVHLWITSRVYNVLHQLENTLETFSFTIQPLSYDNQLQFLEKIWSKKLGPNKLEYYTFNKTKMQDLIKVFLWGLSDTLRDTTNKFLSIPLHLYMISEVFQDSFHNYLPISDSLPGEQNAMNEINLNKMYERFVDIKFFKIRFGEKKPLLCIDDPDMRKLIDNERAAFFYVHKIIAAHVIFGQPDEIELFDYHDINKICDFIERIQVGEEKTGIIEQIIGNKPKFVHYTFAEYFATEFLCDRLQSFHCRTSPWMYLINTFLQSEEGGSRKFFNAKLQNVPILFEEVYNDDLKEMFETLLSQHKTMAKVLFIAIDESLENTAVFLLKCLRTVLSQKNIKDFIRVITKRLYESCIICTAVERSAKNFITFVIDVIKEIDVNNLIDLFNCSDLPNFNPFAQATGVRYSLCWNVELLNVLLSDLPALALVDLFCQQIEYEYMDTLTTKKIIHIFIKSWLSGDIDNDRFDKFFEKLNKEQLMTIFCATDSENKLAAHSAAAAQNYLFFEKLENLLDRHQFIEVCTTIDNSGLTPIHYFEYIEKYSDKLRLLLDKVYEGNTIEKLALNYFIDKKVKT